MKTMPLLEALALYRAELAATGLPLPVPDEEAEFWAYRVTAQLCAMGKTATDFSCLSIADLKGMKTGIDMWRRMNPGKPLPAVPRNAVAPVTS